MKKNNLKGKAKSKAHQKGFEEKLKHNAAWLMRSINPVYGKDHEYTIPIRICGYYDLQCNIANLVKSALLAIYTEEPDVTFLGNAQRINTGMLLEMALQMIPYDEAEFLDTVVEMIPELHRPPVPEYNYSVVRIL